MSLSLFRAELDETDDTGDLQLAKKMLGYAGEEFTGVHRVQPFGFHGVAPAGSHGIGLALRGMRDLAVMLGGEHPQYRPRNRAVGTTAIYDQWGNVVSLVQSEIRIVNSTKITLVAPTIVLDGNVLLGGADANKPASMQGSLDSRGDSQVSNLSTKVLLK